MFQLNSKFIQVATSLATRVNYNIFMYKVLGENRHKFFLVARYAGSDIESVEISDGLLTDLISNWMGDNKDIVRPPDIDEYLEPLIHGADINMKQMSKTLIQLSRTLNV